MATLNPNIEAGLYTGFRYFNRFMLLLWRLGLGSWLSFYPPFSGRIMVLLHTGRKSGKQRRTPLNYAIIDGDIYCTAGFGAGSAWYGNIQTRRAVEVWLPEGWWAGEAEDITGCERHLTLLREVLKGSGVVASLVGVNPHRLSDTELAAATEKYRLVRIRRTEARTGSGGPGDMAWIWPLATHILGAWLLLRRRRAV